MSDFVDKAETLLDLGRYELAIAELLKALAEDPDDAWVHANFARCHLALGNLPKALAAAKHAVQLAPDQEFAHYWMAACRQAEDNLKSAQDFIAEAVRLNPASVASLTLAGRIAASRLQWFEASALLDRALAVDPTATEARNLKTFVLIKTGNHALAESFNEETLRFDPENGFAQSIRGWDLWKQGDPVKASACFDEALRQDPQFHPIRRAKINLEKIKHPVLGRLMCLGRSKNLDNAAFHFVLLFFVVFGFIWNFNVEKKPLKGNDLGVAFCAVGIFVFLGRWTADPLTDFFLNAKARRYLTPEEIRQSRTTAALIGASLLGIFLMVFLSRDWWILGGYAYLFPLLFLLPLLGLLEEKGKKRNYRKSLIVLMSIMFAWFLAGAVLVIVSLLIPDPPSVMELDAIVPAPCRSEPMRILGFWCWNLIPLFALPCAFLVKK